MKRVAKIPAILSASNYWEDDANEPVKVLMFDVHFQNPSGEITTLSRCVRELEVVRDLPLDLTFSELDEILFLRSERGR